MSDLILKNTKFGNGVFAGRDFNCGEKVMKFGGKIFTFGQLPKPYESVQDHYIQISKKLYMGPSGSFDDFFNHSCNPNSGLKIKGKSVLLVAIKNIRKGEEITYDYSTTMDEDDWELECRCGSKNCRKIIRDFKYLPRNVQNRYIRLGIVPSYILKGIKETNWPHQL